MSSKIEQPCPRYRFRVVSPGFTLCPIVVSVDKHNLTMIASDGAPFKPKQVGSFIVHPGERYADLIESLILITLIMCTNFGH